MKILENFSPELLKDAERKWEQVCAAAQEKAVSFSPDAKQINMLKRVFGFSDFVAQNCSRDPAMLADLLDSGDMDRAYAADEYRRKAGIFLDGLKDEDDLTARLRRFRRREMTRIAFRDLSGKADLAEVISSLSSFADACIDGALSVLYRQHCEKSGIPAGKSGKPQELVVLGMGKLGACELNFSSDIDLILAWPEAGETTGVDRTITNDDFFVRLGRRLIHVLGANTADGSVFRVDMDLRPYGKSGPLAMSFDALESYYHEQGREWERYAWIKARAVAGDRKAGQELLRRLNPFIFRKYLDYGVFESLRDMKQKIEVEVRRRGMDDNIKLGPGGIREVEFFGQIFQLIRGGVIPALQERRIQRILELLVHEGYIDAPVCDALRSAYTFLRNTEHRLQEFADAQTHKLPSDPLNRERLALSSGFDNWNAFSTCLSGHMKTVHGHFTRLLRTDADNGKTDEAENTCQGVWAWPACDEDNRNTLVRAGYDDPETVLKAVEDFRNELDADGLSSEGRERIDRLMPLIIRQAGTSDQPFRALERIMSLIRSVRRRTSYVSLLLENPPALDHLVRLAGTSSWILNFLSRHPVLLDELLDPRTLYVPPERATLETELRRRFERIDPDDLEQQMDELRIFRQINVLRVAAADISDAIPLMRVSDYLSDIAETVLKKVLDMTWDDLVEKHGTPECDPPLGEGDRGFVMIAYGKLGGLELSYGSDLDLVFLHSGTPNGMSNGRRPIDNTTFFARLGQKMLHLLSSRTVAGKLYEPDMRLRPSGSSGILVCPMDGFRSYQVENAWTWEKQALIRARAIVGDAGLRNRFEAVRREVLAQPRDPETLRTEIRDMRVRMKKELLKPEPGLFDLKQGTGGIVDIEFLVQYLVLLKAHEHPELLQWTDNVRLIRTLAETGVIDEMSAYFLRKAYLICRAVGHKLNLRDSPALVSDDNFHELREQVDEAWNRYLGKA